MNLTNDQLCTFLKEWGTVFKELGKEEATTYYEICVDAHLALEGKKLKFFADKARLSKALNYLSEQIEATIKAKRISPEFQLRADCFRHIGSKILEQSVIQTNLFN